MRTSDMSDPEKKLNRNRHRTFLAHSKASRNGWLVQGDVQSPAALSAFVITA